LKRLKSIFDENREENKGSIIQSIIDTVKGIPGRILE